MVRVLHSFPTRRSSDLKYFGLLFIVLVAIVVGLPKTGGHFTPAMPAGSFSVAPFGLALVSVLRSEEHTSELQSRFDLVCRLLLDKKKPPGTRGPPRTTV